MVGENLTSRNRLAQMLMQQEQSAPPIQSHTQGLASLLRQGLAGYMQGADRRDRMAAQQAMMKGMGAKPWIDPDTGQVVGQAGGLSGAQAALQGLQGNEYAAEMGQNLQMQKYAQDYASQQATKAFERQRLLEAEKRQTNLQDLFAKLKVQDDLTRQRDIDAETRKINAERDEYGLPPLGGAVTQPATGQPLQTGQRETENITQRPMTLAEAKAKQEEEKEFAKQRAKTSAETAAELEAAEASMPHLEEAVLKLKDLGKKATYTYLGQARDWAARQADISPGEGAKARASYVAHVKNNVLPLLRQTFGAAFTAKEGESLLATLGDPDMHPDEKEAVLDAFIENKRAQIGVLRRKSGMVNQTTLNATDQQALDWANSNPNDPRAAQIKQRLGVR